MENNLTGGKTDLSINMIQMAEYKPPVTVEKQGQEWVSWGEDNAYFDYLIELFANSTTNQACITGIVDRAFGGGLRAHRAARNLGDWTKLVKILRPDDIKAQLHDLKHLGWATLMVIPNQGGTDITKIKHWPANTIRSGKANEEGDVEEYFYFQDWANLKTGDTPQKYPAYTPGKIPKSAAIWVIKRYVPGCYYYSPPDYDSGTAWADLETKISLHHNTAMDNGLTPSMMVNFNNGDPGPDKRDEIDRALKDKFAGPSNSSKIWTSYQLGDDKAATIEAIQTPDAHSLYELLQNQSEKQILKAHRVISPKLLGIYDASGFSNNADEIRVASVMTDDITVQPLRDLYLEGLEPILSDANISLDLYFESLDAVSRATQTTTETKEVRFAEEETDLTPNQEQIWMDYLKEKGEELDPELWEEVEVQDVQEEEPWYLDGTAFNVIDPASRILFQIDAPDWPTAETWCKERGYNLLGEHIESIDLSLSAEFAEPDAKSKDDKGIYRIRYRYAPQKTQQNSRDFCVMMVSTAGQGVVYRREDIDRMGQAGLNSQFAAKGETSYSIWMYKGGVNCHHRWMRVTYKRKETNGGQIIPLTPEERSQGIRIIDENYIRVSNANADSKGVPFDPPGWNKAKMRPIDMPNQGRKN